MYKTRNIGTGNGMRGTRGMGGMLYSGDCRQTFWGMPSNIPENVAKYFGECRQTFRGISSNIPGNFLKHSGECPQTFRRMLLKITENVANVCCKWRELLGRIAVRILLNIRDYYYYYYYKFISSWQKNRIQFSVSIKWL